MLSGMALADAFLLLTTLLGTGSRAGDPEWTTHVQVRFNGSRVAVQARMEWGGSRGKAPETVTLRMADDYEDESGKGYGRFVRNFEAFVPEEVRKPRTYEALVLDAHAGTFEVPVLKGGRVGYRYELVLEHVPKEALGFDETPHAFAGGTFWTGRALFVHEGNSAFRLELLAPEGESVSTSLDLVEKSASVHIARNWSELRQTYFVVGSVFRATLQLREAEMLVLLDDPLAKEHERVVGQIQRFMEAGCELFAGPPPLRSTCFVESHESEGGGAVVGRDAHVLFAPPPRGFGEDQWMRSLCHELFHLWNPGIVGFDSREMWYSEGFTEYWTHRLLTRTGSSTLR